MTLAVDLGRKATKQTKLSQFSENEMQYILNFSPWDLMCIVDLFILCRFIEHPLCLKIVNCYRKQVFGNAKYV